MGTPEKQPDPKKPSPEGRKLTLSGFSNREINELATAMDISVARLCAPVIEAWVLSDEFVNWKKRVLGGEAEGKGGATD